MSEFDSDSLDDGDRATWTDSIQRFCFVWDQVKPNLTLENDIYIRLVALLWPSEDFYCLDVLSLHHR